MFVPFDTLPESARVWIYQSEKKLDNNEQQLILKRSKDFIKSWQSHGNDLKGSAIIEFDHFLIISIDEGFYAASGCSIDKSVHFVQELEQELGIPFMNRSKQSYLYGEAIEFFQINEAKQLVGEGVLSRDTKTFNNNISSKQELTSKWMVPAQESWLSKFFKNNN